MSTDARQQCSQNKAWCLQLVGGVRTMRTGGRCPGLKWLQPRGQCKPHVVLPHPPIPPTPPFRRRGSLVESALCIFPCHVHGFDSEPKSLKLFSCDQETPRRSVCPQRLTDGLEFTTWREWNFVGAEVNYFILSYFQSLEQRSLPCSVSELTLW